MSTGQRRDPPRWLHSGLVLAGTGLLAASLVLVALAFVAHERRDLLASTTASNALLARLLEDQANCTLGSVEVALSAAAEQVGPQHASGDGVRLSAGLLRSLQALPYLRSISLVDAHGRVLASANSANLGRLIVRQRLLSPPALAGLGPLLAGRDLADLVDDELPGGAVGSAAGAVGSAAPRPHQLPLVRPLGAGPQADWLVATVNPAYFAAQYALLLGDSAQRAALLAHDGQLIAASPGVRLAAGQRVPAHPVFNPALPSQDQGAFFGPGLDGPPAHTAYRSTRGLPLRVVVETPEAALDAQMRSTTLKVATATGGLLALLGALGLLVWRSLRSREVVSGDLAAARGNLAAKDAFTDRLFQVSPIPMVVKDTAGRFVRVNKAWTDLTGLATERVIGVNLGRLYPPQLAAPHEVQEQIAIASGLPANYEEQILDSDGLPRDVMIRVMPFTDAGGQVTGVISCLTDVTEFREAAQRTLEAKDAAEHANTAKSEFLANISHELRTPLQGILGFSELGGARSRADARLHEMFSDIHGAGQRMLSLVNNLLDLSRLESTVGDIHLAPTAIGPTLRPVVQELRQMAQVRGLALVVASDFPRPGLAPDIAQPAATRPAPAGADAAGPWVMADSFRLQQVLRNVLANAIRFAPDCCEIALAWRLDGAELLITVRDHGPGIPADETERIFESFVQSSRTKSGAGGTGLGLAICRKIMAAHHGRISAHNHPGGGAVFEIRLPVLARPVAVGGGLASTTATLDRPAGPAGGLAVASGGPAGPAGGLAVAGSVAALPSATAGRPAGPAMGGAAAVVGLAAAALPAGAAAPPAPPAPSPAGGRGRG